jgi:hypothetical protein
MTFCHLLTGIKKRQTSPVWEHTTACSSIQWLLNTWENGEIQAVPIKSAAIVSNDFHPNLIVCTGYYIFFSSAEDGIQGLANANQVIYH